MRFAIFLFVTITSLWALFATSVSAQVDAAVAPYTVTCASQNMRRNYCPINNPHSDVVLDQQLSGSPCTRGQTWGNDGRGIWVDRGCRGVFRVIYYGNGWPGWWNPGNGHKPTVPRNGACFYREVNARGDYFCMSRGDRMSFLPRGYDNQISSIPIMGNAAATIYANPNFQGPSARVRQDVWDLRKGRIPATSDNWNNQISSIIVN